MSPPRRRSARLASSTPKPKATPELDSLAERDESPLRGAPQSLDNALMSPMPAPATPKSSAIKPPHEEMHPSHAHRSTAEEPSSALRLGFTDIKNPNSPRTAAQMTPSRGAPSSAQFNFQFSRQAAAESQLSDEAQRMMDELREKASRFKAELVAQREAEGGNIGERKIAKPRGKSGRFSAAHMAEFKKMDSIEGHASAWRAQDGRFTPVVHELKRSPSKNSINATPVSQKRGLKRSPSKANLDVPATPTQPAQPSLKRTISKANLGQDSTPVKKAPLGTTPRKIAQPVSREFSQPMSAAKRVKKREHDDAATSRPISRDGSSLPRPKSSVVETSGTLSRLMSPTKASAAHTSATSASASSSPNKPTITLVKSTSSNNLNALNKAPTTSSAMSPSRAAEFKRRIISPGRLQRVTSLLRRNKANGESETTAIPGPRNLTTQTPNPPRVDKALPPVPLTTPRRKLTKHVSFTPETFNKVSGQETPSPKKSVPSKFETWRSKGPVPYPALDGILKKSTTDDVSYPDLSSFKSPLQSSKPLAELAAPESTPGRFTFRSDHTIKFGGAPAKGFGPSAGQSSVRHVRGSIMPTVNMPGNFPEPSSPTSHPDKENKENEEPAVKITGVPHGMANKKRHRPTWNEEAEEEAEERATKKRKNEHVPEGQAVVAPRMTAAVATPTKSVKRLQSARSVSRTPGSPSPTKRSGGLSLSRLNMLARPKNRV
ncbi:hypothetical protein LIA77_04770 [Sarocladium implicatum]|nr:hypothetical protein LIA77_04770 [Sarocladium implicatum]